MRDEIQDPRGGPGIDRLGFIADAAVRLAAAVSVNDAAMAYDGDAGGPRWCFDAADVLWAELCKRFPNDADESALGPAEEIWVVFDGPPGPETGRFVETEDGRGNGLAGANGAKWEERGDYWQLGPFYRKK